MLSDFFSYLALRTVLIFVSTAFSIAVVLLVLNIVTAQEMADILNLHDGARSAFINAISRIQEVSHNIINIISQLLNKMFSWAGVDVDLSKIKIDVNHPDLTPSAAPAAVPVDAGAAVGDPASVNQSSNQ